jgi:hypothetical protein
MIFSVRVASPVAKDNRPRSGPGVQYRTVGPLLSRQEY